jgi:outer membrane immunogenic protein
MKKLPLTSVALVASLGTAFAADLPSIKSAPVAAPAPMWTGFYAGINAGATWGNDSSVSSVGYPIYARPESAATTIPVVFGTAAGISGTQAVGANIGFIGGGQIGYIVQYGKALFGLETDMQGTLGAQQNGNATLRTYPVNYYSLSVGTTLQNNVTTIIKSEKTLNYIGTARAKLGYLITPQIAAYATGGLAYGGVTLQSSQDIFDISQLTNEYGLGNSSTNRLLAGWTAGGGFEWMFLQNWSAKVEYIYYDLGSLQMYGGTALQVRNSVPPFGQGTPQGTLATAAGQNIFSRITGNIVRAGVNYHFNFANVAPVVAKF